MANEWVKRNKWIFVVGPLALVVLVAICGEVVMQLWNWLLPPLFGWRMITFWQALGLLVLCRILFGSIGGQGSGGPGPRHGRGERWGHMSAEERESFRRKMRERCCGSDAPSAGEDKTA